MILDATAVAGPVTSLPEAGRWPRQGEWTYEAFQVLAGLPYSVAELLG